MHRLLFNKVASVARTPFYKALPYDSFYDMKIFDIGFLPAYALCNIFFCHGGESKNKCVKRLKKYRASFRESSKRLSYADKCIIENSMDAIKHISNFNISQYFVLQIFYQTDISLQWNFYFFQVQGTSEEIQLLLR